MNTRLRLGIVRSRAFVSLEKPSYFRYNHTARRGVRVAEGARLESVCAGNRTEGSNPSLSAK